MIHANARMQVDLMFAALLILVAISLLFIFQHRLATTPFYLARLTLRQKETKMKKIIRYFSLVIGLLTASFTSLAREKISLMLDWYVNPDHAAIIVAQQKRLFEKIT